MKQSSPARGPARARGPCCPAGCALLLLSLAATRAKPKLELEKSKVHYGGGHAAAEWNYFDGEGDEREASMRGWSYYLRAWNLNREQPTQEIGWGQWTKPEAPYPLDVCGLHPGGFAACTGPEDESFDEALKDYPTLKNCGHKDHKKLRDCKFWVCGEDEKGGIRGSIEGGCAR